MGWDGKRREAGAGGVVGRGWRVWGGIVKQEGEGVWLEISVENESAEIEGMGMKSVLHVAIRSM